MNFLFVLNFDQIVILSRQNFKTVSAVIRYLWCFNFGTSNSKIMFMHKAHQGSKDNLKTLKDLRSALPSYLQMDGSINGEGRKLKIPDTVIELGHPSNNNRIVTFPSARTRDNANNLGRGATMPLQFYDEFAFMPYNQIVYEAASPAFSQAAINAAANNAPYGICIATTPGDLLTDSGQYCKRMIDNATPWCERYYDYTLQQLLEVRNSNHNSNFFFVQYSYQQLGRGPDYFATQVLNLQKNWATIRREVLLEWSEVTENKAFREEDLEIIKGFLREPVDTILLGKYGQYQFQLYDTNIDLSSPPIMGVDVSGALMQDASAITVIDSKTTKTVGTLNCNYITSDDLADAIYVLITRYFPNAACSVERNGGYGVSVIQRLCKTSVKKNLYWSIKDKVIEEQYNGVRAVKRTAKVKVYGVDSNREVRARLIEILYDRVQYHKDKFIAPILYREMCAMEVKKNGKVEHSANSHDDSVFSYLHALYIWYDGENLVEKFNIQKNTIKTDEDIEIMESSFEDQIEKKEKIDLKELEVYEDSDLSDAYKFIEEGLKFKTTKDLENETFLSDIASRDRLLALDKAARESYSEKTGLDPSMFGLDSNMSNLVQLPDDLFSTGIASDFLFDDENDRNQLSPLAGNMADWWNRV